MTNAQTKITCSQCQAQLSWWNVRSCTRCGKPLCNRHCHATRRPYSTVLYSICDECIHQLTAQVAAQVKAQAQGQLTGLPEQKISG